MMLDMNSLNQYTIRNRNLPPVSIDSNNNLKLLSMWNIKKKCVKSIRCSISKPQDWPTRQQSPSRQFPCLSKNKQIKRDCYNNNRRNTCQIKNQKMNNMLEQMIKISNEKNQNQKIKKIKLKRLINKDRNQIYRNQFEIEPKQYRGPKIINNEITNLSPNCNLSTRRRMYSQQRCRNTIDSQNIVKYSKIQPMEITFYKEQSQLTNKNTLESNQFL